MPARSGPAARLYRALVADARRFGLSLTLLAAQETPWASATFVGTRLVLRLACAGANSRPWLDALAEADLPVPGHLVADCAVTGGDDAAATIEALLLEG